MNDFTLMINASDAELADKMEEAAWFLRKAVAAHPDEVRPSVVTDLGHAFGAAAEVGIGIAEPEKLFEGCGGWDAEAFGHMLMQWIGPHTNGDGRKLKRAALEVAEVLGPDHAQTLYRFAVLVTKLA